MQGNQSRPITVLVALLRLQILLRPNVPFICKLTQSMLSSVSSMIMCALAVIVLLLRLGPADLSTSMPTLLKTTLRIRSS